MTAAVLPALVLGVLLIVSTAVLTTLTARVGQRDLAIIAARALTERLERAQAVIATTLGSRSNDGIDEIERVLALALRSDDALTDAALYTGPAERLTIIDPQRLRPPTTASADLVERALDAGGPVVGPIRFDDDRRFVVVQVAVPIDLGIAVGTVRLDDIAPVLETFAVGGSRGAYVVQDGLVALHPDLSLQYLSRPVDTGRRLTRSLEGSWVVRAAVEVPDLGAVVVVDRPLRSVLQPVLGAAGIVIVLGTLGLAWSLRGWIRLQRSVIAPLDDLVAMTGSIRSGSLPTGRERFDVTELDVLAAAVHDMAVEIERRVDALERSSTSLAASNRELEQFAYSVSHDLQAPLRTIAGFLDLHDQELAGSGAVATDRARHLRGRVDDGIRSMYALIDGLLLYSRITTGGASLEARVDLAAVVDDVRRDLAHDLDATGARLTVGDLPTVHGDRLQLRQLLQNLLENAIKFRSPDREPEISVTAERLDEGWAISVTDNGIGIAPQFHDRVFVMFRRLHTAEEYGGQGLGLALCRRIAERHGGTIDVASTPDQGSTFTFTLPADVPSAALVDTDGSDLDRNGTSGA